MEKLKSFFGCKPRQFKKNGNIIGNIRLRFVVKPGGEAFIEFLDTEENVVKRLEP